ncbi:MAG TPA: hypothetical protein EYM37_03795 [Methylophaga aminisulfidivorans]|jgi:hypothetical protein|uniref:hypothetical protein n=1 Tax=Methylophaga TaxID=40222 RepID=UPI001776AA77|nr:MULTISPECIES: hypothetical protein [Methylophaga]HIC47626.1 hypothetical protein [Methylophaga sp.]HIM39043.1 hypothetical protein [Methylophaga aminisulfidivorans]
MRKKFTPFVIVFMSVLTLAACNDDEFSQDDFSQDDGDFTAVVPVPANLQSGMPEEKPKEMLSVADPTRPEVWLLSLYQQKPEHDPDRDVFYYQSLLDKILPHVHEDKRVVSNRLVQVTRQLADKGIEADQDELLVDFAHYLPAVNGKYVFGELIANYSNLRQQNIDHEQAMKTLFELI